MIEAFDLYSTGNLIRKDHQIIKIKNIHYLKKKRRDYLKRKRRAKEL